MLTYLIRRLLYAVPILIGVNLITFALFFVVNTPDDMARIHLGNKNVTPAAIESWKKVHGLDKPLFINGQQSGILQVTDTLFFTQSIQLFAFQFGNSNAGRPIGADIRQRMLPSLALAVPSLVIGVIVNIFLAFLILLFRYTRLEQAVLVVAVTMMSISGMFYIIGGQYFISKLWQWLPISGYLPGWDLWRFILLPVMISVLAGIGVGLRWYRTIFIEELGKEYTTAARARGNSEMHMMLHHVLRNALIPILTGIVVIIPTLFMGSLIMEAFFAIPGLGSYTVEAIFAQDFNIVRAMVYLGSVLYIIGLILTDFTYAWADPRVKLN